MPTEKQSQYNHCKRFIRNNPLSIVVRGTGRMAMVGQGPPYETMLHMKRIAGITACHPRLDKVATNGS